MEGLIYTGGIFWEKSDTVHEVIHTSSLGKYSKIKISKFCGYKHEGGGQSGGKKNSNKLFKSVFSKTIYIILGPPKHVLHLVWGISTAIKTALEVALYDF